MADYVENQILNVKANPEEVIRLTKELEKEEAALKAVEKAGMIGAGSRDAYTAAVSKSTAEVARLRAELEKFPAAAGSAKGQIAGLNMALRDFGYGISDVFSNNGPLGSKIQGFGNNVGRISTGVLSMLGKTGPYAIAAAAGLEVLFTATGALLTAFKINTIEDFFNAITGGTKTAETGLKGLEERIKELTSKPHLIPIEQRELDVAKVTVEGIKAALEAVAALDKSQTEYQKKSGQAVGSTIAEATDDTGKAIGAQGFKAALLPAFIQTLQEQADAEAKNIRDGLQAELDKIKARDASTEEEIAAKLSDIEVQEAKLEKARLDALDRRAKISADKGAAEIKLGEKIVTAEKGSGVAQKTEQEDLARRAREAGLKGVGAQIEASSPELMEHYEDTAEEKADALKRKEFQAARADALKRLVTQAQADGKTDVEVAEIRKKFQNETLRNIARESERLTEESARRKALKANTEALGMLGQTPEQIKVTQTRFEGQANAVIEQHTTEVRDAKARDDAVKAAKQAGVAVASGDTTEQIRVKIAAKTQEAQGETRETVLEQLNREAEKAGVRLDPGTETKSTADLNKIRERLRKHQADVGAMEKALGPDFMEDAASRRIAMEADPATMDKDRRALQKLMRDQARKKMVQGGMHAEEAGRLSAMVGADIDANIRTGLDQVQAVPGMAGANQAQLMQSLYQQLQRQMMGRQQRARVGPRKPNEGAGFRSVPATAPQGDNAVPPAVLNSAARGVSNTDKSIAAISMLATVQQQQGRRLDQAMAMIPGGLNARSAAPRGRG